MLQQTQVATVIPYYERFLARFPDLDALARAPLDRRAQAAGRARLLRPGAHLHGAARECRERTAARSRATRRRSAPCPVSAPTCAAVLQRSPSGRPLAVVDGNVKRVMARLFAIPLSVDRSAGTRAVLEHAEALLDRTRSGCIQPGHDGVRRARLPPGQPALRRMPRFAWCAGARAETPRRSPCAIEARGSRAADRGGRGQRRRARADHAARREGHARRAVGISRREDRSAASPRARACAREIREERGCASTWVSASPASARRTRTSWSPSTCFTAATWAATYSSTAPPTTAGSPSRRGRSTRFRRQTTSFCPRVRAALGRQRHAAPRRQGVPHQSIASVQGCPGAGWYICCNGTLHA